MEQQLLAVIDSAVERGINKNVNGKIDKLTNLMIEHNKVHEEHMLRAIPVIEAYEQAKQDVEAGQRAGRFVIQVAGFIAAIGGAALVIRQFFLGH